MNEAFAAQLRELIGRAPAAVDSFHPGHWALMERMERATIDLCSAATEQKLIEFLAGVAFLKQPYQIDKNEVAARLSDCLNDVRLVGKTLGRTVRLLRGGSVLN